MSTKDDISDWPGLTPILLDLSDNIKKYGPYITAWPRLEVHRFRHMIHMESLLARHNRRRAPESQENTKQCGFLA